MDEGYLKSLKPGVDPESKKKIQCQNAVRAYTIACEDLATAKLESLGPAARFFTEAALGTCKRNPPQNITSK